MNRTSTGRGFLLLHGWQNRRPAGHWQHWLAGRLTELGHAVDYPQLPAPDRPDPERWLSELRTRLDGPRAERYTVVCHSLACLLWLRAAARDAVPVPVDQVLLVAPPSSGFLEQNPEIAGFAAPEVTPAQLAAAAGYTRLVAGDDDPCCPEGAAAAYAAPLGLPVDVLSGGGHLGMDAGYGAWPSLLDWCLDPAADAPIRHA
ncbi:MULTISPECIES: alpha/beta hydrolase [unclassified Streptomyces]|uniref:RBBP9/YdeN family alpha/beta hydrolase n=1 Tax=unclassified Streptomyces TaxID=2593676 RepID=UPI000DC76D32|nr:MULTISPECIES: alpha/beta hydrolase [unclassified Streptomyces]AWZ04031.1 alpha/beta hydrolase [Streptomyces sp. ICC4]AWZ12175.1 alpha/beta hydrolase [Streptomyces sp. ICC1]